MLGDIVFFPQHSGYFQNPAPELSSSSRIVEVSRLLTPGALPRSNKPGNSIRKASSALGSAVDSGTGDGPFLSRCFALRLARYDAIVLPRGSSSRWAFKLVIAARKMEMKCSPVPVRNPTKQATPTKTNKVCKSCQAWRIVGRR